MRRLLIPLFAVTLCAALRADAQQPPPTAAQVAASVQTFYDQLTTLRVRFYLTQVQHITNHTLRGGGELLVLKPGKMRFNFDDDVHSDMRGEVTVSDGDHILHYQRGEDGEPGTVLETSTSSPGRSRSCSGQVDSTRSTRSGCSARRRRATRRRVATCSR